MPETTQTPTTLKAIFVATYELGPDPKLPDPLHEGDRYFYEDIITWPDTETMIKKIMSRNLAVWSISIPACALNDVMRKSLRTMKLDNRERAQDLDDTGIFDPRSRLLSLETQFVKEQEIRGELTFDIVKRFTWCPHHGEDQKFDGLFDGRDSLEGSKVHWNKDIEWESPMAIEQVNEMIDGALGHSKLIEWFKNPDKPKRKKR